MNLIEAKFVINLAEDSLKLVTANIAFRPFDIGTFRPVSYTHLKKTAVNHQIIVKRMQVQLEQAQAQTLGGDSALTETEKKDVYKRQGLIFLNHGRFYNPWE